MTQSKFPNYLNLYAPAENEKPQPIKRAPLQEEVRNCLKSFVETTGWAIRADEDSRIAFPPSPKFDAQDPKSRRNLGWKLVEDQPIDSLLAADDIMATPWVGRDEAAKLLASIEQLVERLEVAEQTIRQQEAELATGVGLSLTQEGKADLAGKFEDILSAGSQQLSCIAAGMYLLDESTSTLKLRACHGLPESRLSRKPRELRGSLADLEALMGNAVMLDDLNRLPEWRSPEAFTSAICVPIGTASMPHGTIWFWSDESRQFDANDADIANLAAHRIMLELERSVMGHEVVNSRQQSKLLDRAGIAQASRLPDTQPLHESFEIDGCTFQNSYVGGAFHDWDLTPRETIVAAIGCATKTSSEGGIVSSWGHSALRSNWLNNKSMSAIITKVNDSLWGVFDTDWTMSMGLLSVNPESGYGSICLAGGVQAFIASARGYRPIGMYGPVLGNQPDPSFHSKRFILQPSETLVLFSNSILLENEFTQQDLLDVIMQNLGQSAGDIAGQISRNMPAVSYNSPQGSDRNFLVLRNTRDCA